MATEQIRTTQAQIGASLGYAGLFTCFCPRHGVSEFDPAHQKMMTSGEIFCYPFVCTKPGPKGNIQLFQEGAVQMRAHIEKMEGISERLAEVGLTQGVVGEEARILTAWAEVGAMRIEAESEMELASEKFEKERAQLRTQVEVERAASEIEPVGQTEQVRL